MTALLDVGPLLDRLSGLIGLKLSLALLHFVWQGVLIAAASAALMRFVGRRSANRRYAIGVAGMAMMVVAPVVTFLLVTPPPAIAPQFTPADLPQGDDLLVEIERLDALIAAMESQFGDSVRPESSLAAAPLTWPERIRLWQPYALLLWVAGTGVCALRLGVGFHATWNFGRGRRALPAPWFDSAARVAERLAVKAPRVFVSERVVEAIAVGLFRPMVLLPAAWIGRIPPEVLEAVLAHELAHLRRHDLWVNLLQRCVEAALFYHPGVWWLSRRVRVEREYCCDEAATRGVSGRAAYARALEFVATERVAARRPAVFQAALAAGMGGDDMALLDRVRRVLGAEGKAVRRNWVGEGLIALAVPVALWAGLATVGPAFAQADEGKGQRERNEEEREKNRDDERGRAPRYRESRDERPGDGPYELHGPSEAVDVDGRRLYLYRLPDGRKVASSGEMPGGDVLIDLARLARGDDERDLHEALRELREEMQELRREVVELRTGKARMLDVPRKPEPPRPPAPATPPAAPRPERERDSAFSDALRREYDATVRARDDALRAWREAASADDVDEQREAAARDQYYRLRRHMERLSEESMKRNPFSDGAEKPPGRPGRWELDQRQSEGDDGPAYFLRESLWHEDEPARWEVRTFRESDREESEGGPRKFIKRLDGPDGATRFESEIEERPRPTPPVPAKGDARKAHHLSRGVTLEIDGKQVPVVVEEHREGAEGPAKEIRVRVLEKAVRELEKAPEGVEERPSPSAEGEAVRGERRQSVEETPMRAGFGGELSDWREMGEGLVRIEVIRTESGERMAALHFRDPKSGDAHTINTPLERLPRALILALPEAERAMRELPPPHAYFEVKKRREEARDELAAESRERVLRDLEEELTRLRKELGERQRPTESQKRPEATSEARRRLDLSPQAQLLSELEALRLKESELHKQLGWDHPKREEVRRLIEELETRRAELAAHEGEVGLLDAVLKAHQAQERAGAIRREIDESYRNALRGSEGVREDRGRNEIIRRKADQTAREQEEKHEESGTSEPETSVERPIDGQALDFSGDAFSFYVGVTR